MNERPEFLQNLVFIQTGEKPCPTQGKLPSLPTRLRDELGLSPTVAEAATHIVHEYLIPPLLRSIYEQPGETGQIAFETVVHIADLFANGHQTIWGETDQ